MIENIQFIGLNKLEDFEKDKFQSLTSKYYEKIKRIPREITSLTIHIKQHKKTDHTSKYSLRIKLIAPQKVFEVEKIEWDLTKLLHKSFNALENELLHHYNSK